MKKYLLNNKLSILLIAWLLLLGLVQIISLRFPLSIEFPYYNSDLSQYPRLIATTAHFDGIHYLRVARYGYLDTGTQAFFPIYPLLIRLFTSIGLDPIVAAISINLIAITLIIIGIKRLYPDNHIPVLMATLFFPTSFFLLSVYTESLFISLVVLFFVFLKNKNWFWAALIAGLASGTRLIGISLSLSLIISYIRTNGLRLKLLPLIILSLSGFIGYCAYLYFQYSDPFMFFHVQPMFGGGRSGSTIILLPQVFYRYFAMLATVPLGLVYARVMIELFIFLAISILSLQYYRKFNPEMFAYIILSLLLPTLSGSLSSIPRYTLALIPFIAPAVLSNKLLKFGFALVSPIFLAGLYTLFVLGHFVS